MIRHDRIAIVNTIIIFIMLIGVILFLVEANTKFSSASTDKYGETTELVKIEDTKDLYYYKTTGVVYIVLNGFYKSECQSYMSPYYSSNGKLCRYDVKSKTIVEIEE